MKSAKRNRKTGEGKRSRVSIGMARRTILLLLLICGGLGKAERGNAQSEGRSLRIWVDTLNFNICDVTHEGTEFENSVAFDNWGVWLESSSSTDTVIGFRLQDSVLTCTVTLRWDTSRIRLQPPYILASPQTLFGRFAAKVQSVDTTEGLLWVSVSPAAGGPIRPVVGTNIPLFYMRGILRRGGEEVLPPEGGGRVQSIEMEGNLGEQIVSRRFLPGFVTVLRDTTPEYTGTFRISNGDLDTNRVDTLELFARNLADRKVREVWFSLEGDIQNFRFVDTIPTGDQRAKEWRVEEVTIGPEKITGHFVSDSDIRSGDSLLLRIIYERTTDSAFSTVLTIKEVNVNEKSCLGKLEVEEGSITAERMPKIDTVDTTDTTTSVRGGTEEREGGVEVRFVENHTLVVTSNPGSFLRTIAIYTLNGEQVISREALVGEREIMVEVEEGIAGGVYFIMIQDSEGRFWNRYFIQQR